MAWGQTDPGVLDRARRALTHEALEARAVGDHARALDRAQRAGQLGMTVSLRRFIAEEQSTLGQTGPALVSARACVTEGEEAERQRQRGVREHGEACRAMVTTLEGQVGRVALRVVDPPTGTRVTVDGESVPGSEWGAAREVTPGSVRVTANAPGRPAFVRDVEVNAGETETVVVSLEAVEATERNPSGRERERRGSREGGDLGSLGRRNIRGNDLRMSGGARVGVGPFVLFGAGALSLGLGTVFFVVRNEASDDYQGMCDSRGCPESAREGYDRAVMFNTLTNVALGVGAAAIVGGVIWFAVASRRARVANEHSRARVSVAPVAGGAVMGLSGEF